MPVQSLTQRLTAANTAATVAALATLIALLGPISGAHFNPAVSLARALQRRLPWGEAGAYIALQVIGCCLGTLLAHAMFELPDVPAFIGAQTAGALFALPIAHFLFGKGVRP